MGEVPSGIDNPPSLGVRIGKWEGDPLYGIPEGMGRVGRMTKEMGVRGLSPTMNAGTGGEAGTMLMKDAIEHELKGGGDPLQSLDKMLMKYEATGTLPMVASYIKEAVYGFPQELSGKAWSMIDASKALFSRFMSVTGDMKGAIVAVVGNKDRGPQAVMEMSEIVETLKFEGVVDTMRCYGNSSTGGVAEILRGYKPPLEDKVAGVVKGTAREVAATSTWVEMAKISGGEDLVRGCVRLETTVRLLVKELGNNKTTPFMGWEQVLQLATVGTVLKTRNIHREFVDREKALKDIVDKMGIQLMECQTESSRKEVAMRVKNLESRLELTTGAEKTGIVGELSELKSNLDWVVQTINAKRLDDVKKRAAGIERRAYAMLQIGGFFSRMNLGLTAPGKDELGELFYQGSRRMQRVNGRLKKAGVYDTVGMDMSPLQSKDVQPIVPTGKYLDWGQWGTDFFHFARDKETGVTLWNSIMNGQSINGSNFDSDAYAKWLLFTGKTNDFWEDWVAKTEWKGGRKEMVDTIKDESVLIGLNQLISVFVMGSCPILAELKTRNTLNERGGGVVDRWKLTKDGWIVDTTEWKMLVDDLGKMIEYKGGQEEKEFLTLAEIKEGLKFLPIWTSVVSCSESWRNLERKLQSAKDKLVLASDVAEIELVLTKSDFRRVYRTGGKVTDESYLNYELLQKYGIGEDYLYLYPFYDSLGLEQGTKSLSKSQIAKVREDTLKDLMRLK